MLGELPPIVALPSNPADVLRPVPVFGHSTGLYETRLARRHHHHHHRDNGACVGNAGGDPTAVSPVVHKKVDVSQSHFSNNRGEQKAAPVLPQAAAKGEFNNAQPSVALNGNNMETLTEKDIDVLLEVLETRYEKYLSAKQQITERYLIRIETDVDRFLTTYHGGGSSSPSRFGGGVASFIKNTLVSRIPSPQRLRSGGNEGRKAERAGDENNNGGGGTRDDGLPSLQESSYKANAISFNYLDVRPTNMGSIAANLVVLRHCLAECFSPGSRVKKSLLDPVVRGVWDQSLRPIKNSAMELLGAAQQNVRPPLDYLFSLGQQVDAALWSQRCVRYDRIVKALQDDLKYLHIVEEMDREAIEEPMRARQAADEGLSDCVPVSGLVLSRLHRLENEHRTAWEFWRNR
ncbi:hypothetical protein BCY84_02388 [Trypanosoma cruzi cruzi]|nr:hypothetical protein BCY84_02388 [Trypanosoma cruzi cruzi]